MHLLSSWPLKENIYGSVNLGCVSIMEITEAGPGPGDSDDLNSQTSRLIENNESTTKWLNPQPISTQSI